MSAPFSSALGPTRALRLGALALLVAALGACESETEPAISRVSFLFDSAVVATKTQLSVQLVGMDSVPLSGIAVRWSVGAGGGTFDAATTLSNAQGLATAMWTPPTVTGQVTITVNVGKSTTHDTIIAVRPGVAASVVYPDTVKFERAYQQALVPGTVKDKYGNADASIAGLEVSATSPFSTAFAPVGLTVQSLTNRMTATGELTIRLAAWIDPTRPVLKRVALVANVPAASARLIGLDTLEGLTIGESQTLKLEPRDANGAPLAFDSTTSVAFTSSNPQFVLANVSSGVVTGVAEGSSTITATAGSLTASLRVPVLKPYDLGALTTLYELPSPGLYSWYEPTIDSTGRSLLVWQTFGHPSMGPPPSTTVQWRDADGSFKWSKSYGPATARLSGGNVFVSSNGSLTAIDLGGTERWTKPISGSVLVQGSTIYVAHDTVVDALAWDGSSLWKYQAHAYVGPLVATPTRLLVQAGSTIRALDGSGAEVWTRNGAGTLWTDDASNSYHRNFSTLTLTAIDPAGATLWTMPMDSSVAVEPAPNSNVVVSLQQTLESRDRTTGAQRWKVTTGRFGWSMKVVGDKILVGRQYIYVYDVATGAFLGRTAKRFGSVSALKCTDAGLMFIADSGVQRFARCN